VLDAGSGRVDIEIRITEDDISAITVNTHQLNVQAAKLATADSVFEAKEISYNRIHQQCRLDFGHVLPISNATVTLSFRGTMNNQKAGFYRSVYDDDRMMFSTQFQPSDARRAFPCFDEPKFKTTFTLQIEAPNHLSVLSNTEAVNVEGSPTNPACKLWSFGTTPPMSVYLLAWAVGEFEFIDSHLPQKSGAELRIRLCTTPGLAVNGKFALDVAQRAVQFFTEVRIYHTNARKRQKSNIWADIRLRIPTRKAGPHCTSRAGKLDIPNNLVALICREVHLIH
jgi:aminopeptidase N